MDEPTWQVTWRHGPLDSIAMLAIIAGAAFVVASVATGWAVGAAMGGCAFGFMFTLTAFLTGHFQMDPRGQEDQQ